MSEIFMSEIGNIISCGGATQDKNSQQAIATTDLGDGLFCVTDSEALAALPCRMLTEHEEFLSYGQLSRHLDGNK